MKRAILFLLLLVLSLCIKAQSANCTFDKPAITMHFGSGNVVDPNTVSALDYQRVQNYCPTDGHYTYTGYTSRCFRDDWHTIEEDHTAGDVSGNMMLVNSSYNTGEFLRTVVSGFKGGTTYEFGVWMMNVCRITEKCPYPLLPNITITLQTQAGKTVLSYSTGDVQRRHSPEWTQYKAVFANPSSERSLILTMSNNRPGGCGNDFALDDITFRECIITTATNTPKTKPVAKKQPSTTKPPTKKTSPTRANKTATVPDSKTPKVAEVNSPIEKPKPLSPPPPVLKTRENSLVKKIEAEEGQINIKLYDNGQIDEDTVSIYHNNVLVISRARLSAKPISLNITIDRNNPHHELIMVAENLGTIPPNTSLMVVTAGGKRYEVFISSTEQKNAKVIFDLKE